MTKNIFNVMTDPRGFIKSLRSKKIGSVPIFLMWIIGMVYLMRQSAGFELSYYFPYGYVLLAAAIIAIPIGYILVSIFTLFLYWAGKLFKGKASYSELFTATAFARIPEFFVVISWLLLTILLGQAVFTKVYMLVGLPQLVTVLIFVQLFFYIWEFVITLHTIGQVQGFSAWMSLWNYILAAVIVLVIALVFELAISEIFSLNIHKSSGISTIISLIK